jgi:hypothetical protein
MRGARLEEDVDGILRGILSNKRKGADAAKYSVCP